MAELIDKKATSKLIYNYFDSLIPSHYYKLDLVKANDCLQEEISELSTTTESEIRAKAIDEFVVALKDEYPYFVESFGCAVNKAFHKKIDKIAEQLKGE